MRLNSSTTRAAGAALLAGVTVAALTSVTATAGARPSAQHHPATRAVPAAAPRLTAAPAGPLTPRNCTQGAGTAACDVYAMAGTTSLNGASVPIWGFSTTGADGSATAPGPVLVVRQHDTVTLTLHNQLSDPVSLALPGQAGVSQGGAAGDDVTGAAPGGTRTYTFSADRAGTFLYEAGHTAGGARQVAMGLAGALVVLPGNGTAYGTAATGYDDEAVLVLSEVDPRLNASPNTFDLRNFRPAYRLINGKPFPAADPISTDQGHKVLLRYVNAGAESHPMGVLGTTQLEVAQDGHPAAYPTRLAAESVDPGATVDTIVTMPSGPEAKFAVYDTSQHLDNNGQTTSSPVQLAFGGMMTFLDTNAPAPSADAVGPVPSHVSASPNPSDGLTDVTVSADASDATTGNSPIDQAEFVVDDAVKVGPGFGTPMTGTFGTAAVTGLSGTIPAAPPGGSCLPDPQTQAVPLALACLDAGKHRIFVRAHDTAGNWGVVDAITFNLPKTGPATTNGAVDTPVNGTADVSLSATGDDSAAGGKIVAAEYFLDVADGANGTGTAMTLNRQATVVSVDATLTASSVAALTEGTHHLYVHTKDDLGLWGPVLDVPMVVDKTGPTVDAVSIGPNPSNGLVSDPSNPGYAVISGQVTDRDAGNALQSRLAAAEAFIDNVKAPGTGLQLLAVDGAMNSTSEKVYALVPLSQLKALPNGEHSVYLRGEDVAGNWGALVAAKLIIDKTAPVLSNLAISPDPTNGAANVTASATVSESIQTAEYFFGTTDPGVGKATTTQPVMPNNTTVQLTIPTAGLARGVQTLNVRVKDAAGNWSAKVTKTFTVVPPNRIFASNFEPGDPNWSASTTGVTDSTAAKVPTTYEPGSTRGMQATLPTFGTRAAYRTDNSPTAEPTYHAHFAFNRNTLNVGTSTATIFRGLTAAGAQAFALQYRVNAGSAQVAVVLNGNRTNQTSPWITLPAGGVQLQLDWSSGAAGTATLTVNGDTAHAVNVSTANGNLTLDTVQLGLVTGFANTNTGSAYFDSFSSGRTSA